MENEGTRHLSGFYPEELARLLKTEGFAQFRAEQLFHWIQRQASLDFKTMSNLPKNLLAFLEEEFLTPLPLSLEAARISQDGTEKFLFSLTDEQQIEAVLIPEGRRRTVCVSTQAGCAMNCSFCATGRRGWARNLSAGEITAQVLWIENRLRGQGQKVSNVVYMGMGEPLANYGSVLKSIRLLNDARGLGIGARRITVSTCGLVPQIRALAQEDLQINLAISLHAVTDSKRLKIMPVNKRYPLTALLEAARFYTETAGRRISFEYALIEGFNDSFEDARGLRKLLRNQFCHLNLIPVNPVGGLLAPSAARLQAFLKILEEGGLAVSVRQERGADIEAACGQLIGRGKNGN